MDEIIKLFGGFEQLWNSIQKYAETAGREATRIVLESYYVVRSPHTPVTDKAIIIAALGYQLLPEDLMSRDKFGLLGFLDNGAALALAYNRVQARLTPEISNQVSAILGQWFGAETIGNNSTNNGNYIPVSPIPNSYQTNQPQTVKTPQQPTYQQNVNNRPVSSYDDDEDVVID